MSKVVCIVSTLLILASPQWTYAAHLESALEGACWEVNTTALDVNWARSVKKWHYPIMSRSDLYQTAGILAKKSPEDIPENKIYYKGCFTWKMETETAYLEGFGGQRVDFKIKPAEDLSVIDFSLGDKEGLATCYSTLTDNQTFYVNACCLGTEMTWGVNSPNTYLPEDTIKMIHDHVEELGFSRKQFTGLSYGLCSF